VLFFGGAPKTSASRVIHMVIGNKLPFSIPRGNRSTSHRTGHASGVRSPEAVARDGYWSFSSLL
jgi:hypothetical protein